MSAWTTALAAANRAVRDTFGEAVVYTPAGKSPESITAEVNLHSEELRMDGDAPIMDHVPTVIVVSSDLSQTPAKGDRFTIRGTEYVVVSVEDHDTGRITCRLVEAAP